MTVVFSIGFFMSLFLVFLIAGKKSKVHSDKFLAALLFIYALTIGGAYMDLWNRIHDYPLLQFINIHWLFLLLHGPFLWMYVHSLTDQQFKTKPIHLLHGVPFAVFFMIHFVSFIKIPAEEKMVVVQNELFINTLFFKISVASIGISSLAYNWWALKRLRSYRNNIENQYSNIETINLKWLKTLVVASLVVFFVNVVLFNLNNVIPFAGYYELSQVAYVFASGYVLYLGFFGIRQGKIFADYPTIDKEQNHKPLQEVQPSGFNHSFQDDTITELTKTMTCQKPYLDPELSLVKLSLLMKTKPEVISKVLNAHLHQNFFDYINKYRIEEFKKQCLSRNIKHLSILGMAYECGFNSKAAFYRAFKKFESTSPSAYISKALKKSETPLTA